MNNKKSAVIAILMVLAMMLALCACGNNQEEAKNTDSKETVSETTEKQDSETEDNEVDNTPSDLIDLKALSAVENKDESKVKIIAKEIERDAVSGFTMKGGDALYLTAENNDSADVTSLVVYVVGYDSQNGLAEVQTSYSLTSYPYVQAFKYSGSAIKSGSQEKFWIEVDADAFTNVKVIVASYTTADGSEHENPIADEWLSSVKLNGRQTLN